MISQTFDILSLSICERAEEAAAAPHGVVRLPEWEVDCEDLDTPVADKRPTLVWVTCSDGNAVATGQPAGFLERAGIDAADMGCDYRSEELFRRRGLRIGSSATSIR